MDKILVVKLSAFGDFMIAMGCFKTIRKHHRDAKITLLTTKPFKVMAEQSGYFDQVIIDDKPSKANVPALMRLRKTLRAGGFDRAYDLQINGRSCFYHRLLWDVPFIKKGSGGPAWAGIDKTSDFYTPDMRGKGVPALQRNEAVLKAANIDVIEKPDLSWLDGDVSAFDLPGDFALLVTGSSATGAEKRWPLEHYAGLARRLIDQGIMPVLIGGSVEKGINLKIKMLVPEVKNLTGQTSFGQLASLGRKALFMVGNDTGPSHLAAMCGCPSLVLFSKHSDPLLSAPIGPSVDYIQIDDLADLEVDHVFKALPQQG